MKGVTRYAAAALFGVALSSTAAAQVPVAEPRPRLSFEEVWALASERNPRLRALDASAVAAAARVDEASTLPDPTLQLGVMNVGLPDFNTNMPNSMVPSVQLMQMVPFPGKLGLRGRGADLTRSMAEAAADEGRWALRSSVAGHFYDLYALDRQLEVMTETLSLLMQFQTVAKAMYAAGTGRQADVLRADVEVARMDADIRRMSATRRATGARLNGLLDRPAATELASPVLDPLPRSVPSGDTLFGWAQETRPLLERGRLGVDRARAGVQLAHREIWPNLTFGLQYGQRGGDAGTRRMASAVIGFSLPVHASSRQFAARDEAAAIERMAAAELGGILAEVDATIGLLLADLDRSRTLIALYQEEILPEARTTVESAFSSYRVGSVDFMTLVDAQMTVNRFEGEFYALLADYGKALARLESAVGRALPPSDDLLAEYP